jgi:hypothetical protein
MKSFLKKFVTIYLATTFAVLSGLVIDRHWHSHNSVNAVVAQNIPDVYVPAQVAPPDKCLDDQVKFCSGVTGIFNMSECLYRHHQSIAKACLAKLQEKQLMLTICSLDIEKKCAGMKLMDYTVMSCLKEHREDLSMGCMGLVKL